MTIGIMQPYFLPYLGYFQLIEYVDMFVVYDNIQFTKKGWIHRNRILENGEDVMFSLSLKKDSDYLNINQRYLSENWPKQRDKTLRKISNNYRKASYFESVFPLIESIFLKQESCLFDFIYNSVKQICRYLGIETELVISSTIAYNHNLMGEKKVIDICCELNAQQYVNPIGGLELYSTGNFKDKGIKLRFLKSEIQPYPQFKHDFVSNLSIIDVMMFNSKDKIRNMLKEYVLI